MCGVVGNYFEGRVRGVPNLKVLFSFILGGGIFLLAVWVGVSGGSSVYRLFGYSLRLHGVFGFRRCVCYCMVACVLIENNVIDFECLIRVAFS